MYLQMRLQTYVCVPITQRTYKAKNITYSVIPHKLNNSQTNKFNNSPTYKLIHSQTHSFTNSKLHAPTILCRFGWLFR